MNRQVRLAALATVVASTGITSGQSPPSTGPAGSTPQRTVYVMKTAGQPERRVQVISSQIQPDGSILTDVRDLATGAIYTLANPAFLGKPAPPAAATQATNTAHTPAPSAPGTPRPLFGQFPQRTVDPKAMPRPLFGQFPNQRMATVAQQKEHLVPADQVQTIQLPQARERTGDPLLAGAKTPAGITSRTPYPSRIGETQQSPSVLGKLFADPTENQPKPRVGILPAQPKVEKSTVHVSQPMATPGVTVVMPRMGSAEIPKVAHSREFPSNPQLPIPEIPAATAASVPPQTPAPQPKITVPEVAPTSTTVEVPLPEPTRNVAPAASPSVGQGLAVPSIDPNAKPSAATGLFDSQSSTRGVILPSIEESNGQNDSKKEFTIPTELTGGAPAPVNALEPAPAPAASPAPALLTVPVPELTPPPSTPDVAQPAPAPTPTIAVPVPEITLPAPTAVPAPAMVVPVPDLASPTPIPSALPTPEPTPTPLPIRKPADPIADIAQAEPTGFPVPAVAVSDLAQPMPITPASLNQNVDSIAKDLPREIRQHIEDIKNHRRPSFRMESATMLAESNYAKHPAAIDALLHGAIGDRTGVVRGHCIARLADLGYSDPTYLKALEAWTKDVEPAVQRAAVAARAKLTGR